MRAVAPLILLWALTSTTTTAHGLLHDPAGQVEVLAPVEDEAPTEYAIPVREERQGALGVFLPESCLVAPDFDLLIHFHGAPPVIRRAYAKTGLNAVVAVENWGVISNDYSSRYALRWQFEALEQRVLKLVQRGCPGPRYRPRRIALSAWSAGYAAVNGILSYPDHAARIDAVLLSDGLHCGFTRVESRHFPPRALGHFVSFAREAAAGRRLMVITHTQIPTAEYASTTESTSYLLDELGIERLMFAPSVPDAGMQLESRAQRGNLTVSGYLGGDEAAHAAQLHRIGETLFAPLRRHWESTAPPATALAPSPSVPVSVTVEVRGDQVCTQVGDHVECRPEG